LDDNLDATPICIKYLLKSMSSAKSPKLETKQFLDDFFELITKEIYQNEKHRDVFPYYGLHMANKLLVRIPFMRGRLWINSL
jgi:hypothetical protein